MGQRHVCTFRHAQRAAYRTAISAAQILVWSRFAVKVTWPVELSWVELNSLARARGNGYVDDMPQMMIDDGSPISYFAFCFTYLLSVINLQ